MKKLLKQYGFNSDMQYYEMTAESFTNGQQQQAIEQFKALPKENRKAMVKSIANGNWNTPMKRETNILIDNI